MQKRNVEKDFFKMTNNAVFGKSMANVRKIRAIKHLTTKAKRNHLVSEPKYHKKYFFHKICKQ